MKLFPRIEELFLFEGDPPAGSGGDGKPEGKPDGDTPPEGGDGDLKEIEVPDGADESLKKLISKRNSELKNLRERAKTAEEKAAKYDELEEAKKSESEKLVEKAAAAENRAVKAELDLLRMEVASDKGLTPAQAKRLVGSTKEELEADADELLETFKPPEGDGKGKPPGKPRERLSGGGDPTEETEETDPRKLAAMVPRA